MQPKKKKYAFKSIAIVSALALFAFVVSLATGILKIDIIASSLAAEIPENYQRFEGKIENKIQQGKNFIFFTASYCGPCKAMSNMYKLSAIKYSGINFVEADIEENRDLANEMKAVNAPTVLFIEDGKVLANNEVGINEIEKTIDKYASL